MRTAPRLPVIERADARNWITAELVFGNWSAIVPAAGRGSRLNSDAPKILYPLAGRPLLDHLMDLLDGLCSRIVLVVSPDGLPQIAPHLSRFPGREIAVTIQEQPRGMADAVASAISDVVTEHTLVIWGDQAGLRRGSIEMSMRLHAGQLSPAATLATVVHDHPYIHFQRSADGELVDVLQAREGDRMPARGESDCGLFLFKTAALARFMAVLMKSPKCAGRKTGELNFLPILPLMASAGEYVLSARVATQEETLGLNTREDAARLDSSLTLQRSATG